uniref:CdiA C-terminal domain-containing protein n=1 Tax=Pseudonocardia sp. CA-138482 TaxID=3240023 RepID=UPI003F494294
MSVLLGAAVLVWLAGAVLSGLADTTSVPAGSPVVVPVAAVDGSPDDQSAGGAPKSAGASRPQGSDSGGSSASSSGHPASGKPDTGGGSGSEQSDAHPAAHPEPQSAPADEGSQAAPQQAHPAPPQAAPGNAGDDREQAAPKPPAKPEAPATDGDTARVHPVAMTAGPQPGEASTTGAPRGGQPERPNSDCQAGNDGCGGAPAVPPNQAPAPSSAGSGGAGSGGAAGAGGQPGIDNDARPGAPVKPPANVQPQQPAGQVVKNKDPRTGLDPPAADANTPAPNTLAPKPGQPGAPAQSGQVPDNSTLPGLAAAGTPRVLAASAQMPQAGQTLPAPSALVRPVPSDDSGTDGQDPLHRLAGAGLVVGGAALTAASAAGVLAGGAATAGTGGLAAPLTVPEMAGAAAGITTGLGMMGTGMAMATEPSSTGAIPHPRSEEPAAPEAGTASKPAPPRGTIDESAKKFSPEERRIAETLADEGKNVKALREENDVRTPDTEVDGKRTEFKTLNGKGDNTVKNTLDKSAKGGGQARDIVLDARDVELTKDAAELGIARHVGNNPGRYDSIRVMGRDYDFTWHP